MSRSVEHLYFTLDRYSVTHCLMVNGRSKKVSGCKAWAADEAVRMELNRGKVAEALVACIKADNNFISESFYNTFGKRNA